MKFSTNIITNNEQECIKEGLKFSRKISNGDTIVLEGDLGSGKTTFVKGILKGLNFKEDVTSPTFTLVNEYNANIKVIHIDFYREPSIKRWESIGFYEYLSKNNLIIIEWPNLIPEFFENENTYKLYFEHFADGKRRIFTKYYGVS